MRWAGEDTPALLTFPKLPFPSTTMRLKSERVIFGSPLDSGTISEPRRSSGTPSGMRPLALSILVFLRNSSISYRGREGGRKGEGERGREKGGGGGEGGEGGKARIETHSRKLRQAEVNVILFLPSPPIEGRTGGIQYMCTCISVHTK